MKKIKLYLFEFPFTTELAINCHTNCTISGQFQYVTKKYKTKDFFFFYIWYMDEYMVGLPDK